MSKAEEEAVLTREAGGRRDEIRKAVEEVEALRGSIPAPRWRKSSICGTKDINIDALAVGFSKASGDRFKAPSPPRFARHLSPTS
jgi:hypothetical protein